jgi:hypothetical protein
MFSFTHSRTQALVLVIIATFAAAPAIAVEPPPGTKNFSVPSGVPNYFSNEVGAAQGSGGIVRPAPAPSAVAVAPSGRSRVAVVTPRRGGRYHAAYSRGRGGRGHAVATRGRGGRVTVSSRRGNTRPAATRSSASRHVVKAAARSGNTRRH